MNSQIQSSESILWFVVVEGNSSNLDFVIANHTIESNFIVCSLASIFPGVVIVEWNNPGILSVVRS